MNRYLTEKTEKFRWWHIPIAGFSLLLIAVSIQVWAEDKDVGDYAIFLAAHAAEVALVAWPLVHVIRHWLRRRSAYDLAGRLARRKESSLPLAGLDQALGVKGAAKKIKRLTAHGFLQLAGVDEAAGCLWLSKPEPEEERREAARSDRGEFAGTLERIRQLNDDIADEAVSQRIDRIEAVTASIFRTVAEQPDHAEAARRFLNYYLPTTLKLLETYSLMEGQSYQGENIRHSRQRIEDVLDKLVHAIEQQQDKLFQSDALDVDADIAVLERMMASE